MFYVHMFDDVLPYISRQWSPDSSNFLGRGVMDCPTGRLMAYLHELSTLLCRRIPHRLSSALANRVGESEENPHI